MVKAYLHIILATNVDILKLLVFFFFLATHLTVFSWKRHIPRYKTPNSSLLYIFPGLASGPGEARCSASSPRLIFQILMLPSAEQVAIAPAAPSLSVVSKSADSDCHVGRFFKSQMHPLWLKKARCFPIWHIQRITVVQSSH